MTHCRPVRLYSRLLRLALAAGLTLTLATGCNQNSGLSKDLNRQGKKIIKTKKVLTAADLPKKEPAATPANSSSSSEPASASGESISGRSPATTSRSSSSSRRFHGGEGSEMRRIGAEIQQSLELGPTQIVWLFDSTESAQELVDSCRDQAQQLYESTSVRELLSSGEKKLLTSVVTFDDKTQFTLEAPTDKPEEITQALTAVAPSKVSAEKPFTAIKQAVEKYAAQCREQGRSLMLVMVTDEAGEDSDVLDAATKLLKNQAIPLFVIGPPAPWGQVNPFTMPGGPKNTGTGADGERPHYGPESVVSERVHVAMPAGIGGFRVAKNDLFDSGFGSFGLERLCRAGGGAYLITRPRTLGGFGKGQTWPSGTEFHIEPNVLSKYAPEYISKAEYDRLTQENKARFALTEAAKQGFADSLVNPDLRFPKSANEAQMKTRLDEAQRQPARIAGPIDKLYQTLQAGEADRDKLTSPRLQVEYDYAYGRVLAAKARNDGYNQMLAALKNGKGPKDSSSNEYVLEPADNYETNSALKKMAEKAKLYLERVVKDHPGTPWAKLAEDDLQIPMGWKFSE